MSRSRAWCFTVNNPSKGVEQYENLAGVKYIIVGDEVGESGTPHHQGYIMFRNQKQFHVVKELLPEGAHLEVAKGSPQQNIDYCGKQELFYEFGDRPKQGKRNDLEQVRDILAAGGSMQEVVATAGSYQAMRAAEMILKYSEPGRDWVPEVYWFHGPTGSGKTRAAHEMAPDAWWAGKSLRWWDGYDGHEDVIIDDFRGDFCMYHELLRILDRYPYRIEHKGGSRQLLAKRFIITCPVGPTEVYQTHEDKGQLLRRITEIRAFGSEISDVKSQMSRGNTGPSTEITMDEIEELLAEMTK